MSFLRSGLCLLALSLTCLGCKAAPPPATSPKGGSAAAAPTTSFKGMGPVEVKEAFKKVLIKAIAPRVRGVDKVDETSYRYRVGGIFGNTNTITIYLYKIGRVEVTKGTWVFVFDKGGQRIDKVKFKTVGEANELKALIDYVAGPEFKELAQEAKKARLEAMTAPTPTATQQPAASSDKASLCSICGEPRGDENPCPHCGME